MVDTDSPSGEGHGPRPSETLGNVAIALNDNLAGVRMPGSGGGLLRGDAACDALVGALARPALVRQGKETPCSR
jgi:hypothetical protein